LWAFEPAKAAKAANKLLHKLPPTQPAYCATVAMLHFSTIGRLSWDRVSKALLRYEVAKLTSKIPELGLRN